MWGFKNDPSEMPQTHKQISLSACVRRLISLRAPSGLSKRPAHPHPCWSGSFASEIHVHCFGPLEGRRNTQAKMPST